MTHRHRNVSPSLGKHRVLRGQHTADGQAVAHVRIRHQRARYRHQQQTRLLHLHHHLVIQPFAPLMVIHRLGARWRRCSEQRLGKVLA